ncbi:Predicted arabinose efflux permease, MFS family [Pedococcus dokdonensis]|uniref:Predicted arabinose efflux permease, MFS family n=1 Tax=Pedococcus dokdonensis TaxID=443156 RepID=A0A1H0MY12_9MICO|nr:MFS transporter [Pedococcus dokdonensis]SDO85358.1 Predicted arabinose efflux permease, MFS family [Pedococcus dokdonensis]
MSATSSIPTGTTRSAALRLPRHPAFTLALASVVALMVGASAPSPFYPVLQAEIGFSAGTMTTIFGVYALTLLATLLVTGSLSDHIGRRPVLAGGFLVLAVSMVGFWHADGVAALMASRAVQGVAAGLLMSTMSAAVVDLEPSDRPGLAATLNSVTPMAGLAVGALLAGLVLDTTSHALTIVFATLTALYVALAVAVLALPETSPRHDGWRRSLRPRIGIPAPARPAFRRSAPALFAGWATGGLYLSLGAPIVGQLLGGRTHLAQGAVVTVLTAVGGLSSALGRRRTPRQITLYGTTSLAVGTLLTLWALHAESLVGFLLAAVVAGSGFGTAFLGIMRSITPTVGPEQRGELFSSVFVVSYLAFGLPAVAAGFAAPHLGLERTAIIYGLAVVVLSGAAALARAFTTRD